MLRTLASWWRRGRVPQADSAQLSLSFAAPASASPVRAPRRSRADADAPLGARLALMHAECNARCFGGTLTTIAIVVSGRMRSRLGHYQLARKNRPGVIAISRRHLRRHGWVGAQETLLHEMVHQWQDEQGLPVDHGADFRRIAKAVGITPRATRRV